MTGTFLLDALLFLIALIAPGVALVWALLGTREPLALAGAGTAVGVFGIPFVAFAVAMLLRTHISAGLVLATGVTIGAAALAGGLWRRRRRRSQGAES